MPHASVPPNPPVNCASCWADITHDNYVEYLPYPSANKDESLVQWSMSKYCQDCIKYLLKTQWKNYTDSLQKTTCKAEQRRLLKRGPPINLRDEEALPCPDSGEVMMLWFMSDNHEHPAKLEGSLVGEEREKFWQEQMKFYIEDEADDETKQHK